jgi:hypothetical protein
MDKATFWRVDDMGSLTEMQAVECPLAMVRRIAGQAKTVEINLRAELARQRVLFKHRPHFSEHPVWAEGLQELKDQTRAAIRTRKRWENFVALLEAQGDAD